MSDLPQPNFGLALVGDDPVSFTNFPELPPEIRLMIWELLVPPRVVEVDHHYPDDVTVTSALVKEIRPVLLSVCQEARQLARKKYTSAFIYPRPTKLIWEYTGSVKSVYLRQTLKALRLPQKGTVASMPKVIAEYMNTHQDKAEKYKDFGTKGKKVFIGPITPLWYNPKSDALLINAPSRPWARNLNQLWRPYGNAALKIRHLAIELDHFHQQTPSRSWKRTFTNRILRRDNKKNPIRFRTLATGDLETVTLLLKEDCEVITIRLDDTGKLQPEQWAFELDKDSEDFKDQMDTKSWSGVTWRVILGNKEGVALWDRLATWKWNYMLWEQYKTSLNLKKSIWHEARRVRCPDYIVTQGRTVQLVPGERFYFGPLN